MLVLERYEQESIYIGHDIIVRVIYVRGGKVKLGIDAPKSIPVHREEVYRRIMESKNDESYKNEGQI